MAKLIADSELVLQLSALREETEIVDAKGRPLGRFIPIDPTKLQPRISDEELLCRATSPEKGMSTAELLAMLEVSKATIVPKKPYSSQD